ncbi:hypothetical protein ACFYP4_02340 [Streptomyces sp. NPDC005551]|uniref:hypothetical protein n=1 Tax=Streptomyces sp. NPDC005551 TaxID=3364725 RepID=UPI0036BF0E8C
MPKYSNTQAMLISKESGEEILPGSVVPNFRGVDETFLYVSQLPSDGKEGKIIVEAKVGGEIYPSVIGAKIVPLPRWRVMRGEELIGRAEQMAGNPVNTESPRTAADWKYVAMGSEWSQTASTELREEEPGVHHLWAVREPYTHGQGYKHEDTGIRIVDAWKHGQ